MKAVMVKGPVVTAVVAFLAMAGVVGAFMSGGSRYVDIAEAKELGGDSLHLAGVIKDHKSHTDRETGHILFELTDKTGVTCEVEHVGVRPASLMDADKVVAVGSFHNGKFISRELLVKCPSKYKEDDKDPFKRS